VVDPGEVRAHLVCGSEAAEGCDALDGVVGVLKQVLRTADFVWVESWSFLTNHTRVLLRIAQDPGVRLREIAASLGITQRSAYQHRY